MYKTFSEQSGDPSLSRSSFYELWEKEFPDVKVTKETSGQPRCTPCINIKTALTIRTLSKEDRQIVIDKMNMHLSLQSDCRSKYYKHIKKSKMHPDRYISVIIDNMDQAKTRLPAFAMNSKADAHLYKLQHHLTGVKVHHLQLTFAHTWTDKFHSDCNVMINALVRVLVEVSKRNDGKLPPVLYLQADNSGKDNKNAFVMMFLAWLVKHGIFQKVKYCFLMVGHTHEDIDQVFSRISTHMKQTDAKTLDELLQAIENSVEGGIEAMHIEGVFDYKRNMADSRGAIEGISGPHQFVFKKVSGKVTMLYKDWPTDLDHRSLELENRIPSFDVLMPAIPNPKMAGERESMLADLPKWRKCGRLSEMECDKWCNFLNDTNLHPNIPSVKELPACTMPRRQDMNSTNQELFQVIEESSRKERQTSVLKLKKKKL